MIRIAVCDDQTEIVEQIKTILIKYSKVKNYNFEILTYTSGEKLASQDTPFDLIFLDVEMPDFDGIQTAQLIRRGEKKVKIVYVTNHSRYSLNVFAVHPFDYILKPVTKDRIFNVMDEFFLYREHRSKKCVITFNGVNGQVFLDTEDIYYFEYVENRRIVVSTKTGSTEIRGGIAEIYKTVKPFNFITPHKSFVVNAAHIKNIRRYDVVMANGVLVPVAQKRYAKFKNELSNYFHNSLT